MEDTFSIKPRHEHSVSTWVFSAGAGLCTQCSAVSTLLLHFLCPALAPSITQGSPGIQARAALSDAGPLGERADALAALRRAGREALGGRARGRRASARHPNLEPLHGKCNVS